jgi:hypothetical protein
MLSQTDNSLLCVGREREREIHLVHFNGQDAVFVLMWQVRVEPFCLPDDTTHPYLKREECCVTLVVLLYSGSMERFVAFQGNFGAEYARF